MKASSPLRKERKSKTKVENKHSSTPDRRFTICHYTRYSNYGDAKMLTAGLWETIHLFFPELAPFLLFTEENVQLQVSPGLDKCYVTLKELSDAERDEVIRIVNSAKAPDEVPVVPDPEVLADEPGEIQIEEENKDDKTDKKLRNKISALF